MPAPTPAVSQVEEPLSRLEEFRSEKRNYHREAQWFFQRRQLAENILETDPNNALANLELAEQHLVEFYRYYNRVTLPDNIRLVSDAAEGHSNEDAGDDIFVGNPFDLEQIQQQGGMVLSMNGRASAALQKAAPFLERAVAADQAPVKAYEHLVRVAAIRGSYEEALSHIERMCSQFENEPEPWLYLGLAHYRLGNVEAADNAFRQAFERMTPEMRTLFDDVTRVRNPRADSLASIQQQSFWRVRDPRRLSRVNERKLEHYARLTYADLLFREERRGRRGWNTERGFVYVRYGSPNSEITRAMAEDFGSVQKDNSVQSAQQTLSESLLDFRAGVWDYGDFEFVFYDPFRNGEYQLYSPSASAFSDPRNRAEQFDYVIKARETFRETPERYDYEPPGEWIAMPFQAVAFRGEGRQADVYLNYGIPLEGQVQSGIQRDVEVSLEIGAFVLSEDELVVERRRTLEGLPRNHLVKLDSLYVWASSESLAIAPGSYEVSFEAQTVDERMWGKREISVDIPNFSGGELKMSQILLAYGVEPGSAGQPGAIFRDGLIIQPAPWGVYGTDDPIYLYFEVYGLGMDGDQTNYEVEAELLPKDDRGFVERVFEGREPGVSNAFPVQADRADDSQYVILDASGQPPGEYTLTVSIEDKVSGQTVEQETELFLE